MKELKAALPHDVDVEHPDIYGVLAASASATEEAGTGNVSQEVKI